MALSIDQLLPVTDASSLLDQVEAGLRRTGNTNVANELLKFQQDAGEALAKGFHNHNPAAGSRTARLDSGYKEVTPERFSATFKHAHAALQEGDLKNTFGMLSQRLLGETHASTPAKQQQKMKM